LPTNDEMLEQIMKWEIERPGIAGPFWSQFDFSYNADDHDNKTDIEQWMLTMIAQRKGEEPNLECYNGIDFHAHEVLSGNPTAIRKLIELGAEEIAAMAATEIDEPIDAMREILIDLGFSKNEMVRRICCWHLAYNYRFLHEQAKLHNLVRVEETRSAELFFVFDEAQTVPYAATIYPKRSAFNDHRAHKWLTKLTASEDKFPGRDIYETPQQLSFEFGARRVTLYGDTTKRKWNRIWIKWPRYPSAGKSAKILRMVDNKGEPMPIERLKLSSQLHGRLQESRISTIDQLMSLTYDQAIKVLGKEGMEEVVEALRNQNPLL
jgi:hypothetical protein